MGERAMDMGTVPGPRARVRCRCEAVVKELGSTGARGGSRDRAVDRRIAARRPTRRRRLLRPVEARFRRSAGARCSRDRRGLPQDSDHPKRRAARGSCNLTESEITDAWLSEEARSVIEGRLRRQNRGTPRRGASLQEGAALALSDATSTTSPLRPTDSTSCRGVACASFHSDARDKPLKG